MNLRRLAVLQWLGFLVGGVFWFAAHIVGFGIAEARCGAGGAQWGIDHRLAEGTLMAITIALIAGAEACALAVLAGTRDASYESDPPVGRMRLFAIAAATANVLFLIIVLLDGVASIYFGGCGQS